MKQKKKFVYHFLFGFTLLISLVGLFTINGFAGSSSDYSLITPTTPTPTHPQFANSTSAIGTLQISQSPSLTITASPTETISIFPTIAITETLTPTTTFTYTPTVTPTLTSTPTPIPTTYSLLPFIFNVHNIPVTTPAPIETVLLCADLGQPLPIPDNDPAGVSDTITSSENQLLVGLGLYIDISHGAVGDLIIKLTNQTLHKTITVLNNPGNQASQCYENDIITILDDAAIQPVNDQCAPESPAISGIYLPSQNLSTLTNVIPEGNWRLTVADVSGSNTGSLNNWCLVQKLTNILPQPTPTSTPVSLPSSAYVSGMSGQSQFFNLDCESRSAVDWAKHFGDYIDEIEFFYNLPRSNDDPEVGFVGAPNGRWGNIPPDDYGVHSPPISDLLNDYGLTATAYHFLSWDDIRAEIASGNPVITWIIGDYSSNLVNGIPHPYIPSTGEYTVVAPYEHTVIVIGYSPTEVTVLNGSKIMPVPLDQFLDSWSVLQFMGVLAR